MTVNQTTTKATPSTRTQNILSPKFNFPKPSFIPNFQTIPSSSSLHQQSAPAKLRAKSASPTSFSSNKNLKPIPVEKEISSVRSVSPKRLCNITTDSVPRRLYSKSQCNHLYYADGVYANAPHPSELPIPTFN